MGKKTTHVANEYHEDIYAKVAGDQKYVVLQKYAMSAKGVSASMNTKYKWQLAEKDGYTAIKPKDALGFNPATENKVYITIISDSGRVICNCYPIDEDYSVFVDENGYIKEAEHGTLRVAKK